MPTAPPVPPIVPIPTPAELRAEHARFWAAHHASVRSSNATPSPFAPVTATASVEVPRG